MSDTREVIDELAGLIEEFKLDQASLQVGDLKVSFAKRRKAVAAPVMSIEGALLEAEADEEYAETAAPAAAAPTGNPISTPMAGIFYSSSGPGAPPFVTPGATVAAGDVVGLIEAMKVFNEITSPFSGVVDRLTVESGAVVAPGDVLMYIK